METVNIEFEVHVRGSQYNWENTGRAELRFDMPVLAMDELDVSSVLKGLLKVAYLDYLNKQKDEEDE